MRRNIVKAALIAGLLTVGASAAADEITSAELLAFQCAGCHGFNGHSVGPATPRSTPPAATPTAPTSRPSPSATW